MGAGDWVMATAAAERVPDRAVFGDGMRACWSDVFEGNPKIAGTAGRDTHWIPDFPGHRPYVERIEAGRYTFREDFRAPYGKLYISDEEREWAERQAKDYILVEPYIKEDGSALNLGKNKAWDKWDALLKLDYPWLQIGIKAPKVRQVKTDTIRKALAMVAGAKLVVTTDGLLHHAAAALGVPAVVLWGGVVSPKILGYPTHVNVWNGAVSCGSFKSVCPHCREAMESISLDQVTKCLP